MQIISGTAIGSSEVAEQVTHGPKLKGSKPAPAGTKLWKYV
jgi:hypothetical protein